MSALQCARDWRQIWDFDQNDEVKAPVKKLSNISIDDVQSLISHERQEIERQVEKSIAKWRALDERKFKNQMKGWAAVKLRLPMKFDYLSKSQAPPIDDGKGERVVSLNSPGETLSYEAELWKIFNETKTIQELRRECAMRRTCSVKNQLQETDANRMILDDRHGLPANDSGPLFTTLHLEFWRQGSNVRRRSMESHRMVLEFLGEQTLLDVHAAIQELTDDSMWTGGNSGMFFIENVFYKTGEVDYVSSIRDWLDEDASRKEYLGITSSLEIKRMESTKLEEIQWSLNTRYVHIHHGDVESSLFLTDIRQTPKHLSLSYPIIHDIWAPSFPVALCEGCKKQAATLVTYPTCSATDGAAQICKSCHDELFGGETSYTMDINAFKEQRDLISAGNAQDSL